MAVWVIILIVVGSLSLICALLLLFGLMAVAHHADELSERIHRE